MESGSRSQSGFTLLELLVATAVIAVIAAIAIVTLLNALDRARQRSTMADMRTISGAIEAYAVDFTLPPDDSGGLAGLLEVMIPYSTNVLPIQDHWGFDYVYARDASGNYTVESFGKDGINGTNLTLDNRMNFTHDLVIYNGVFVAAPE